MVVRWLMLRLRCQQLHHLRQHVAAILAAQRECELCGEQPIFHADVVTPSVDFVCQIALVFCQVAQCWRKTRITIVRNQIEDSGRKRMDAEEAQVMTGTQARHDQRLLGFGGVGFSSTLSI